MTNRAIMVKIISQVIWIGRTVVISSMTAVTSGRSIGVTVGMAMAAGQRGMGTGKWKFGQVMIKYYLGPVHCIMTGRTVMIKIIAYMIGIGDRPIFRFMT